MDKKLKNQCSEKKYVLNLCGNNCILEKSISVIFFCTFMKNTELC